MLKRTLRSSLTNDAIDLTDAKQIALVPLVVTSLPTGIRPTDIDR